MLSEGNAATVQAFLDKRYPRTAVLTARPTISKAVAVGPVDAILGG